MTSKPDYGLISNKSADNIVEALVDIREILTNRSEEIPTDILEQVRSDWNRIWESMVYGISEYRP